MPCVLIKGFLYRSGMSNLKSILELKLFRAEKSTPRRTIAYARVSSYDQQTDLERQKQVLELYCARQG